MRLKLPHFPRIITAGVYWGLFLTVLAINGVTLFRHPLAYSNEVYQVLSHPFSGPAHEGLAQTLWKTGRRALANQEFAIASELSPVLGVDSTAQAQREAREITYWKDVAATHPEYRDAYIQLAALLYAQGNLTEAKASLTHAAALDPNGKTVHDLLKFISP